MANATDFAAITGNFIPPGVVIPFAGATAPSGWLLCDGSAISRTTYAPLFAAIASAWGYGDNSTTFNLPDLRGRFLRGRNANGSVVNEPLADAAARGACNLGGNTAENVGSVQTNKTSSHTHNMRMYVSDGTPNAGFYSPLGGGSYDASVVDHTSVNGGVGVGSLIQNQTDGGAETRANNAYVNYIIKF